MSDTDDRDEYYFQQRYRKKIVEPEATYYQRVEVSSSADNLADIEEVEVDQPSCDIPCDIEDPESDITISQPSPTTRMRDTQRLIAVWGVFVIFVICMIGVGAAVQNASFVNDGKIECYDCTVIDGRTKCTDRCMGRFCMKTVQQRDTGSTVLTRCTDSNWAELPVNKECIVGNTKTWEGVTEINCLCNDKPLCNSAASIFHSMLLTIVCFIIYSFKF